VNIAFSKLKAVPLLLRLLVIQLWFVRFILRGFKKSAPDNVGGVLVNKQYKLIFVGNPKVATSTMKHVFSDILPDSEFYLDISFNDFAASHSEKSQFKKFTFVRDPVERIYSCWLDKISNQKRAADIFIITRFKGLYPDMPFESFVNWLCSTHGADEGADRHWMSQSSLLSCASPNFQEMCFINVLELTKIVNNFTNTHGLPEIVNLNINRLGSEHAGLINISLESRNKIIKRYSKDYEMFKFTKPILTDSR
jgi:hypothetical protein